MAKSSPTHEKKNQCERPLNITLVGVNKEQKKALFFHPRCKQWDCEYCQELNRDWWVWVGMRGASLLLSEGIEMSFITLTSRAYSTPNKSIHFMKQNWPKLVRRAKYHTEKKAGQKWAYMLIPERTKAGILHAHLIACTTLSSHWWHDNGYATGFGFSNEAEPIDHAGGAAKYISKYLGKDMLHTGWPKGFRRVRTSRNWPKPDRLSLPGWEWSKHSDESAWFEYYLLKDYGYDVKDKR